MENQNNVNSIEKLEALVTEFAGSRDKDAFVKMMEELEKAVVIIPAQAPANMTDEMKEAAKAGEQIKITKEFQPIPNLLMKTDGTKVLPMFTSMSKIPEDKKTEMVMRIPFSGCVKMAMNNADKIQEFAVNPFSDNVTLTKALIEMADKRFRQLAEAAQQPKTIQMTEKQFHGFAHMRVSFELLPKYFFNAKEKAFEELREQQEKLVYNMYEAVYPKNRVVPYMEDDFSVMTLSLSDTLQITRIDMPDHYTGKDLPVRIYITWENQSKIGYFVIARGDARNKIPNHIARIYQDGKFDRLGPVPDNGNEIETIVDFLKEQ